RISYCLYLHDAASSDLYTLSLHDALPISDAAAGRNPAVADATADRAPVCKSTPADRNGVPAWSAAWPRGGNPAGGYPDGWIYSRDRKSTRLNSSHVKISYAVFCLKKKNDK